MASGSTQAPKPSNSENACSSKDVIKFSTLKLLTIDSKWKLLNSIKHHC